MACYRPVNAWQSPHTGRLSFQLSARMVQDGNFEEMKVPCRNCLGCRLDRARDWAIRIQHEASMHDFSSFVTLTYDNEHLPQDLSLNKRHVQLFMKSLRKHLDFQPLKYFAAGEYGPKLGRPHYHLCIMGYRPDDLKKWKKSGENILYTSETIDKLWKRGFTSVGELTYKSAGYTARYIVDKLNGKMADDHYKGRQPEFSLQSNGIGRTWYEKYQLRHNTLGDFVVHQGKKLPVPEYYDKLLGAEFPYHLEIIKKRRKENAEKRADNNTDERLSVREEIQIRRYQEFLQRNLSQ